MFLKLIPCFKKLYCHLSFLNEAAFYSKRVAVHGQISTVHRLKHEKSLSALAPEMKAILPKIIS
jgi:hypothetical protein